MLLLNQPQYLLLLLFYPLLIYLFHFRKSRGGRLIWSFKLWQQQTYLIGPRWPHIITFLSHAIFWLAATGFIIAMADPQITSTEKIYISKGSATMIVLDESPSMAARDFGAESRFESAQAAVKRFIESRENDEIGLTTFSKEAALRVPLTQDYPFLIESLERVRLMELGDGTSIGMGLAMAALHLSESSAASKNIILITDGANNAGEIHPEAAIEILASLGINTFVIGLGRPGIKNINFIDPHTGLVIDAEIDDDSYDEELLQKIAADTRGLFFRAETFTTFESAFEALDAQDTNDRRFRLSPVSTSYRSETLLAAFILALTAIFIRTFILREVI
jgi:Ca-activated chloride channel family protein